MSMPYVWHPSQQAFPNRPQYASDRVYDSKGFAIPAEYPHYQPQMMRDGYRHGARVNPEKDAYWTTELQDNPLGLANMHITAAEQSKPMITRPASRSQAHPQTRNSYPPKSNARHPLASSSKPVTRDPSPAYLRHDRGHMPEVVGQQDVYDTQPIGVDYDSKRQQRGTTPAPTHRDRYPVRRSTEPDSAAKERAAAAYGARSGLPANAATFDDSSAIAYEQSKVQSKTGISRRVSNARPMERSRTMPARTSRDADLEGPPPLPHAYHHGREPGVHSKGFVPQDYLQEPAPQVMDGFVGDPSDLARVRDWVNDAKRHTVDGMEHMRPEEHYANPRYGHGHPRENMTRHGSAPASAQVLPGSSGRVDVDGIHEEPEDMHRYREQAPVDDYSSSSSDSGSDDEAGDIQHPNRIVRSGKGTPFPPNARRLTADDEVVYGQDSQRSRRSSPYSGSSRSKRSAGKQSTHTSIGKRSFEREREREADQATEGDESATSYEPSIFAKGPQIDFNSDGEESDAPAFARPPVTPERKHREYVSREIDRSKSPYAPAHPHAEAAKAQPQIQGYSSASGSTKKPSRSGTHERSPSYAPQAQAQSTTPARLAYLYRGNSASPSPQGHARSASVQPPPTYHSSASQDALKVKKRSPRNSRSPSPYHSQPAATGGNEYFEPPPPLAHAVAASNATPTRHAQSHSYKSSSASAYAHAQAQARTPTHTHTLETPTRDGRRRSSSRAASHPTPTHPSSHSHSHSHAHSYSTAAAPQSRHVRHGLWNRRGDHLTETGYVVYCPPGRNFPADLANYPENAFMDHYGKIARARVENYPELPESVPKAPGRAPEKGYDSFIKYVLMPGN